MIRALLILVLLVGLMFLVFPSASLRKRVVEEGAKKKILEMVGSDTAIVEDLKRECDQKRCAYTFSTTRHVIGMLVENKELKEITRGALATYEGKDSNYLIKLRFDQRRQIATIILEAPSEVE